MNGALQSGLTWPQARALAEAGQLVRRALWAKWLMFQSGLWFITPDGSYSPETHVVQAFEFQRTEFLAVDWTNVAPDQNGCVGLPGLTATLTLSAGTVTDGGSVTGTITIPAAETIDTIFILTATPPGMLTLPATVTIPAGSTSATFTVTATAVGSGSMSFVISASNAGFGVAQAGLGVVPAPMPAVEHFSLSAGGAALNAGTYGAQTATNPFGASCTVSIQGSISGNLVVNGVPLPQPSTRFTLAAGASFTIADAIPAGTIPAYDLQVTFTP